MISVANMLRFGCHSQVRTLQLDTAGEADGETDGETDGKTETR